MAEKEEEKLIPVGPGVEDESKPPVVESKKEDDEDVRSTDDERTGVDDDGDLSDEEREARRQERRQRKERQHAAKERDKRELNFLRERNEELEKRFSSLDQRVSQSEVHAIDGRLSHIKSQIAVAEQVHAKAVADGAGDDATEALRIRDELKSAAEKLEGARNGVVQSARTRQSTASTEQPGRVDPVIVSRATDWIELHDWYKPDRSDEDSAIVGAIDDRLIAEGFDPKTDAYWNELTKRVKRRLPERFESTRNADDDDERPARVSRPSGGPKFTTGGRERPLKKNEVYVSPERKAAMIEHGVWEDPVLREKYLKRYQEWDRDNSTKRNAG